MFDLFNEFKPEPRPSKNEVAVSQFVFRLSEHEIDRRSIVKEFDARLKTALAVHLLHTAEQWAAEDEETQLRLRAETIDAFFESDAFKAVLSPELGKGSSMFQMLSSMVPIIRLRGGLLLKVVRSR